MLLSRTRIGFITLRHGCCCFWLSPVTMAGCCYRAWGEQVLLSSSGSVVCHHIWHVTLPVVTSMLCKTQSLIHDRLSCSFARVHVDGEFSHADGACKSLSIGIKEHRLIVSCSITTWVVVFIIYIFLVQSGSLEINLCDLFICAVVLNEYEWLNRISVDRGNPARILCFLYCDLLQFL